MIIASPVTKEVKRVEAALGRNMEKVVKASSDALWARVQEENAKREKASKEHMQQLTTMVNSLSKDLPAMVERTVKKELSAVVQSVARTITPVIEKTISTSIADCFQVSILCVRVCMNFTYSTNIMSNLVYVFRKGLVIKFLISWRNQLTPNLKQLFLGKSKFSFKLLASKLFRSPT